MFGKGIKEDRLIFFMAAALVLFGLVMVYSASSVTAMRRFGDSTHFLKKQALWASLGFAALFVLWNTDYAKIRKLSLPLLVTAFVALVLVLIPGVGAEYNGSRRWFSLMGFSMQPTEFVKPALIVFLAASLSKRADRLPDFVYGLVPYLVVTGVFLGLVFLEPDLGTTLTLGTVVLAMLFFAGARPAHLAAIVGPLAAAVVFLAFRTGYWKDRIDAWLHPSSDPYGVAFQINQSFMAFGGGGLTGLGLGQSRQKLLFLPEPHSDFIYSVIGEELGIVGALAVAALFAAITFFGIRLALKCEDPFGSFLAFGVTTLLGLQSLVNMGVATGLFPNKGMPLPFISSGGSAMFVALFMVGMLLSVAKGQASEEKFTGVVAGTPVRLKAC